MKRLLIISAALIIALTAVNAQKRNHDCRKEFGPKMLNKLELNEDQQKKVDEIHFAQKEKAIDMKAELNKKEIEIEKMMKSMNIDGNSLLKLTGEIDKLKSEMHQAKIENWLKIYNILDDKQKETWVRHFGDMKRFGDRDGLRSLGEHFRKGERAKRFD